MSIERYVLVDESGEEIGYEYDDYDEAVKLANAERPDYAVVAHIYEFAGSDLVWTPDGAKSWPPA